MDFLHLIGDCEVRKIIITVVDGIETASILLNCGTILHMFTNWVQFILYKKVINAYVTIDSNNKVPTISIESV